MRRSRIWSIALLGSLSAAVLLVAAASDDRGSQSTDLASGGSTGAAGDPEADSRNPSTAVLDVMRSSIDRQFPGFSVVHAGLEPEQKESGPKTAQVIAQSQDRKFFVQINLFYTGDRDAAELINTISQRDPETVMQTAASILPSGHVVLRDDPHGTQLLTPLGDGYVLNLIAQDAALSGKLESLATPSLDDALTAISSDLGAQR